MSLNNVEMLQKLSDEYYGKMDFDVCCSGFECSCRGMPIDPDYFIWKEIENAIEYIKELETKIKKLKSEYRLCLDAYLQTPVCECSSWARCGEIGEFGKGGHHPHCKQSKEGTK